MKLVDEKGKVFHKFNLVDLIVVLLLVVILVAIGWKVVSSRMEAQQTPAAEDEVEPTFADAPHLVYQVVASNVPTEVADACVAQMQLSAKNRQLMSNGTPLEGYVMQCDSLPSETEGLCTVYFTMEAALVDNEGIYSVGSQEIRVGKTNIVKTYNIEVTGSIYSMEVKDDG